MWDCCFKFWRASLIFSLVKWVVNKQTKRCGPHRSVSLSLPGSDVDYYPQSRVALWHHRVVWGKGNAWALRHLCYLGHLTYPSMLHCSFGWDRSQVCFETFDLSWTQSEGPMFTPVNQRKTPALEQVVRPRADETSAEGIFFSFFFRESGIWFELLFVVKLLQLSYFFVCLCVCCFVFF